MTLVERTSRGEEREGEGSGSFTWCHSEKARSVSLSIFFFTERLDGERSDGDSRKYRETRVRKVTKGEETRLTMERRSEGEGRERQCFTSDWQCFLYHGERENISTLTHKTTRRSFASAGYFFKCD